MNTIEEALEDIRNGKVIIVVDDESRENEGDFVVAAEKITSEIVNFMLHEGRGILCVSLPQKRCEELKLQKMEPDNTSLLGTPFTISVDYIPNSTTGVASKERAATILSLVEDSTKPTDLARPGHIFPLYARNGGVLEREGHTEAVVDITRLAGLKAGGALIEIMNEAGEMARLPELEILAKKFSLKIVSIADLIKYRKLNNL